MQILRLIIGVIVLLGGRELYWFFVGVAGFIVGVTLADRFLIGGSELLVILISLAIGGAGALLAIFAQRMAVALAGFVAGGYFLTTLIERISLDVGGLEWIAFVVGGIIGAILVAILFDWALIFLSSLVGATLILQTFQLAPLAGTLLFLVLLVFGFLVQATQKGRSSKAS